MNQTRSKMVRPRITHSIQGNEGRVVVEEPGRQFGQFGVCAEISVVEQHEPLISCNSQSKQQKDGHTWP